MTLRRRGQNFSLEALGVALQLGWRTDIRTFQPGGMMATKIQGVCGGWWEGGSAADRMCVQWGAGPGCVRGQPMMAASRFWL